MIETTARQKGTLKKIEGELVKLQQQSQSITMQRNSYVLGIIEASKFQVTEGFEINKDYNLEKVEQTD
jgi:hypothetical protein